MYNYLESIKEDVENYIEEEGIEITEENAEEIEEQLNDYLWCDDSVTGNASGIYTFNAYEAEQNLCGNWWLLAEALEEFCCEENAFKKGPEWCDVTIRCYLLGQAIGEVISERLEA